MLLDFALADFPCPFPDCALPVELEDRQMFKSSDPLGYTWVSFYRCAANHFWPEPERER